MKRLICSESLRRIFALTLVFVMMFSLMGTSGYVVFADEILSDAETEEVLHEHDHDHGEEAHDHELELEEEQSEEEIEQDLVEPVQEEIPSEISDETPAKESEEESTAEVLVQEDPEAAAESTVTEILSESVSELLNMIEPEETLAEEEPAIEEEPEPVSTEGTGTPYVYTEALADGVSFVLAYEEDGLYQVVAVEDGELVVRELSELTTETVGEEMLWQMEDGAISAEDGSGYLTVSSGLVRLTAKEDNYWSYSGKYVDYTTWSDDMYLISVVGDKIAAYSGVFDNATDKVVFYVLENETLIPTKTPTKNSLRATKSGAGNTHYLAFASDLHGNNASCFSGMTDYAVEYVGLVGDMVDSQNPYTTQTIYTYVKNVFSSIQ